MNRKFYLGLFLVVAGTAGASVTVTLLLRDLLAKKKPETPTVTLTGKEVFAHLYAIKSVIEKADEGGYDNVQDHQAAMESDFAFFKIEFMES
jgi:hypothetical protein